MGRRPQFLFAEPSYIGMHLFGILLPLMWLMRGRDRIYAKRLRDLIVTYAVGAVLMQAGTRIVIDSVVALLIALVARTDWHDGARRVRGMLQILGAFALGLLGMLADSRLSAIAENGAEGDGSFFARIYQSLDPICGLLTHPWTLLTGYGAGNIINAVWAGAAKAGRLLDGLGMNGGAATGFAAGVNADTVWTMCAYTSVIAEYGLIGLAMLVGASMVCMTGWRTVFVSPTLPGVIVVMALPAWVRANPASGTRPSSAGSSWSHTCTSNARTMRSPLCRSSCSPPRR